MGMDLHTMFLTMAGEKGPSGFEEPVAKTAQRLLEPYVDETWFDRLGSLVGCAAAERRARKRFCWTPIWTRSV